MQSLGLMSRTAYPNAGDVNASNVDQTALGVVNLGQDGYSHTEIMCSECVCRS